MPGLPVVEDDPPQRTALKEFLVVGGARAVRAGQGQPPLAARAQAELVKRAGETLRPPPLHKPARIAEGRVDQLAWCREDAGADDLPVGDVLGQVTFGGHASFPWVSSLGVSANSRRGGRDSPPSCCRRSPAHRPPPSSAPALRATGGAAPSRS